MLRIRSRDFLANVDATPAEAAFEIDASPPAPVISAPAFGEAVRGVVSIVGTASDERFAAYAVLARPQGSIDWDGAQVLRRSTVPVASGPFADWDTASLADGRYEVRLAVADTLGLTDVTHVSVLVDNSPPWAEETSPARVSAREGGHVYSLLGEIHLYFPPRALRDDALVSIEPLDLKEVPKILPSGTTRAGLGFEVSWRGAVLEKPFVLDLSLAEIGDPSNPRFHFSTDGVEWIPRGRTNDASTNRLALSASDSGRYAVFTGGGGAPGASTLSVISFTPRVFSPRGSFATTEVAAAAQRRRLAERARRHLGHTRFHVAGASARPCRSRRPGRPLFARLRRVLAAGRHGAVCAQEREGSSARAHSNGAGTACACDRAAHAGGRRGSGSFLLGERSAKAA